MQLKEAFEAVTENIDVRPGFVGDVMTGARRRRTRKLLIVTAVVALLVGGIAGGLLTRSEGSELTSADQRFNELTRGALASDPVFLGQVDTFWVTHGVESWQDEQRGRSHVYWAGTTEVGPTAVVLQQVQMPRSDTWGTAIAVVTYLDGGLRVVGDELPSEGSPEQGAFRFGPDSSTYLVLDREPAVQYSMRATRGNDGKLRRDWRELPMNDGVATFTAGKDDKPMFVASEKPPASDDFGLRNMIRPKSVERSPPAFRPHPGLGWDGRRYTSGTPSFEPESLVHTAWQILRDRSLIDYDTEHFSSGQWSVITTMPDTRTAITIEFDSRVFTLLYNADGTFLDALVGNEITKGTALPVRVVLPDGQGTVVVDYGTLLGPDEKADALLVAPGTSEVRVRRGTDVQFVRLT